MQYSKQRLYPKLKENREHTKGLCYAADKQVKNIEGEYANI